MMDQFLQGIMSRVQDMIDRVARPRWGIVASVDPVRMAVKVTLQPDGVLSGWLPIASNAAGAGWGVQSVPTVGDQAYIVPDMGSQNNGVVVGFAHSDAARAADVPASIGSGGVPNTTTAPRVAGEMVMTHKSGSTVRLCADGSIYMRGDVNIEGNLRVNKDIFDQIGKLDGLRQHYNTHKHGGVQTGGGQTAVPTITDP